MKKDDEAEEGGWVWRGEKKNKGEGGARKVFSEPRPPVLKNAAVRVALLEGVVICGPVSPGDQGSADLDGRTDGVGPQINLAYQCADLIASKLREVEVERGGRVASSIETPKAGQRGGIVAVNPGFVVTGVIHMQPIERIVPGRLEDHVEQILEHGPRRRIHRSGNLAGRINGHPHVLARGRWAVFIECMIGVLRRICERPQLVHREPGVHVYALRVRFVD